MSDTMSDPAKKRTKSYGGTRKAGTVPSDDVDEKKKPPPKTKQSPGGVLLPELPATVWGKHIAPFLSRKQQNRLHFCRKEISKAMEGVELRWPTIELEYPDTSRYHLTVSEYNRNYDKMNGAVTAFTHDSKYLVLAPIPGGKWGNPCPGLYVWNIRSGLQTGIAHNMNRNNVDELTTAPETILFSGDDRYLAAHRCKKSYHFCVRHDIYDIYNVIHSEKGLSLEFWGEKSIDEMQKTLGFTVTQQGAGMVRTPRGSRLMILGHPKPDVHVRKYDRHPTNPHVYIASCWKPKSRYCHTLDLIEGTSYVRVGQAVNHDCTSTELIYLGVTADPPVVWHPDGEHIVWFHRQRFHILNPFAKKDDPSAGGTRKRKDESSDKKESQQFSPPDPWAKQLIDKANAVIQRWTKDRDEHGRECVDHFLKISPDGNSMVLTVDRKKQLLISVP